MEVVLTVLVVGAVGIAIALGIAQFTENREERENAL